MREILRMPLWAFRETGYECYLGYDGTPGIFGSGLVDHSRVLGRPLIMPMTTKRVMVVPIFAALTLVAYSTSGFSADAQKQTWRLILRRYDYGCIVTNIPREVSICFNCQIALSAVAELLLCSICRRSVFSEGSLSLIVHRHTNTLASWKLAIRTVWLAPGKLASK